jgi:hypothetical protein
MGRTYKRNDTYKSNRPKSIREKRQQSSRNRPRYNDTFSTDYGEKYNKPTRQFNSHSDDNYSG